MASPKLIQVSQSINELRSLLKNSKPNIAVRIRMLLEIKKNEANGISKRELADLLGVNHNSVQSWRTLYINNGICGLLQDGRIGFKPSIINKEEHQAIEAKLRDPKNGLRGYKELQEWIENEFGKTIKYNTLMKYSIRHFQSKSKIARKSHINKDENKVDLFKKTSVKFAKKSVKKEQMSSRK